MRTPHCRGTPVRNSRVCRGGPVAHRAWKWASISCRQDLLAESSVVGVAPERSLGVAAMCALGSLSDLAHRRRRVDRVVMAMDAAMPRADKELGPRASAEEYVRRVSFRFGPPRLIGAELEWLTARADGTASRPELSSIVEALGPHAPKAIAPSSSARPLPSGSAISLEPGGRWNWRACRVRRRGRRWIVWLPTRRCCDRCLRAAQCRCSTARPTRSGRPIACFARRDTPRWNCGSTESAPSGG